MDKVLVTPTSISASSLVLRRLPFRSLSPASSVYPLLSSLLFFLPYTSLSLDASRPTTCKPESASRPLLVESPDHTPRRHIPSTMPRNIKISSLLSGLPRTTRTTSTRPLRRGPPPNPALPLVPAAPWRSARPRGGPRPRLLERERRGARRALGRGGRMGVRRNEERGGRRSCWSGLRRIKQNQVKKSELTAVCSRSVQVWQEETHHKMARSRPRASPSASSARSFPSSARPHQRLHPLSFPPDSTRLAEGERRGARGGT